MKIHRFFGNFNFTEKNLKLENAGLVKQLKTVLRLKPGEKNILADGKMNEALAEIINFGKNSVEVKILEIGRNQSEPNRTATLYCAVLKRENFEWAIQKAVEAGIKEIMPVITKRTVKLAFKQDRLQKIIQEAAEQSGRGIIPVLHQPMEFDEALKHAEQNAPNLFFDPVGKALASPVGRRLGVWVGPEGGWDEEEIAKAKNKNFPIISLGRLTLRAETAAVIASYLVLN